MMQFKQNSEFSLSLKWHRHGMVA